MDKYEFLTEIMMEGEQADLDFMLLYEGVEEHYIRKMGGERSLLLYAMLFEQLADMHNIYLYQSWDDAQMVFAPTVETYMVTFHLSVPHDVDFQFIRDLKGDVSALTFRITEKTKTRYFISLGIPRNILDDLEDRNQERLHKLKIS